MYPALVSISGT